MNFEEQRVILVVEDDPDTREMMVDLFETEQYLVATARTGEEGLRLARQDCPDLIVLDLALPTKSGLDVLRELKESRATRDIPVVVVSAYTMHMAPADVDRAAGVLQKPFSVLDLLEGVGRLTSHEAREVALRG